MEAHLVSLAERIANGVILMGTQVKRQPLYVLKTAAAEAGLNYHRLWRAARDGELKTAEVISSPHSQNPHLVKMADVLKFARENGLKAKRRRMITRKR